MDKEAVALSTKDGAMVIMRLVHISIGRGGQGSRANANFIRGFKVLPL
jgi:hypothetical protein